MSIDPESVHFPSFPLVPIGSGVNLGERGHSRVAVIEICLDDKTPAAFDAEVASEHLEAGVAPGSSSAKCCGHNLFGHGGNGLRGLNGIGSIGAVVGTFFNSGFFLYGTPNVLVPGGLCRIVEPVKAIEEAKVGKRKLVFGKASYFDPVGHGDPNGHIVPVYLSPKDPIAKGRTELIEHLLTGRVCRHGSFFDGHALQTSKRR